MSNETSIVLFGLTGSGKSSIANMLIQGDIQDEGNKFKVHDDAVGVSVNIIGGTNDNFIVYDTVGIGESSGGTVPHKEAVKKIRNYFSTCQVPLNFIAYVKKRDRISDNDQKMFKIFKEIFKGGEKNFIIIITDCGQKWVEKNSKALKNNFGDYPIIPVDFPWSEDDDGIDTVRKRDKRIQSLKYLTDELYKLVKEGIIPQVLSAIQEMENDPIFQGIITFIPVVGTSYKLISSGVYYKMGKSNLAKQRLKHAVYGAAFSVGVGVGFRVLRNLDKAKKVVQFLPK